VRHQAYLIVVMVVELTPLSHAYAYWKTHADQFSRNFYFRGYSGWALRLAQVAFFLAGVSGDVKRLCQATTIAEQERIWQKKLRPVLLNKIMLKGFLGNPAFNWHALGVPKNQMNCFLEDGTVEDFVKATLDPVPSLTTVRVSIPLAGHDRERETKLTCLS
jgi:betaine lipid synthase